MERRFARLRPGTVSESDEFSVVPSDGMCLSSFLVISPAERASEVLLGRVHPDPGWAERGALGPARAARVAERWMLPSSQLLLFESPSEAARRIGREMLGVELEPGAPAVFSEAYQRPEPEGPDPHWDLEFIFRPAWTGPERVAHPAWSEIGFRDPRRIPAREFARGHEDILALVGKRSPTDG
ncbi:MAG TPA: hypothetical protein VEL82_01775 [Thermoplasmata archaeon]|nr:hypothetical protein [Thermoplasmata archaeon]